MTDQTDRQRVCLTMIVKNEAHIVHELIDVVAPLIDYWVVVDTGSDDGTQEMIREHMGRLGIPGELHERPWRDFGHNRSEAIALSQGKADYIWMMDADDTIMGTPEFRGLTLDCYYMLIRDGGTSYWRRQLFRDGVPWHYRGVLHEFPHCDGEFTEDRLYGDYYIHSRRLGARNKDPEKYLNDAKVLLAHVAEHPNDERSVFYLAQSYHNYGDFENARHWYARRAEMGAWEEEVFYSLLRVAECLAELDAPWMEVQDAFLRAWEYRPVRVEPLYGLAFRSPSTRSENTRRRRSPSTPPEACSASMWKAITSPGSSAQPRMVRCSRVASMSGISCRLPSGNHLAWWSMKLRGISHGPRCELATNSSVECGAPGPAGSTQVSSVARRRCSRAGPGARVWARVCLAPWSACGRGTGGYGGCRSAGGRRRPARS